MLAGASGQIATQPTTQPSPPFEIQFAPAGLKSLTSGGTEFVVDGGPKLLELKMPGTGAAAGDSTMQMQEFNAARQAFIQVYPWGSARIDYKLQGNDLQMDVTVKNAGRRALSKVMIGLMTMKFPAVPDGSDWKGRFTASVDRTDDLPVVMADWHERHIAMCCDDIDHFTHFGWKPDGDTNWEAFVSFGEIKPITAGETRTTRVSFRIGVDQPGVNPWIDADDVCKKYAAKYPSELTWPDRRPIGSAFLATSVAGYKTNPRGWFLDPSLDTSTPDGREKFKTTLMTYADAVIAHCKQLNAQGVIVWDIEGQEMPHATSYLADPRMLSKVAPEMDAVADEFMKKFTDAGLRTGITLRPTRVAPNDHGPGWMQQDVSDQTSEIEKKVQYAQKRWGCTLYYCDSNVDFVKDAKGKVLNDPAMPAVDFKKIAQVHKDCLLMPEHKTSQYWAYTAPYMEFRQGHDGTTGGVLETYPHAFSVMQVVDGPSLADPDSITKLTQAIRNGDVLLFRPWWDDPQTTDIEHIYSLIGNDHHS